MIGDHVAILSAPGKLLASGSPVSLKTNLGEGYTVSVRLPSNVDDEKGGSSSVNVDQVMHLIRQHANGAWCKEVSDRGVIYGLKTKDASIVRHVLDELEDCKHQGIIVDYEVHSTTLEDIFITLMGHQFTDGHIVEDKFSNTPATATTPDPVTSLDSKDNNTPLNLSDGRETWFFQQAWTIFRKRLLILRRSWLAPLLAVAIASCGSILPLSYLKERQGVPQCEPIFAPDFAFSLLLPWSTVVNVAFQSGTQNDIPIISPPDVLTPLGTFFSDLPLTTAQNKDDFTNIIQTDRANLTFGGLFVDSSSSDGLLAFEASERFSAPTLLNAVSNILLSNAAGGDPGTNPLINANYMPFPTRSGETLIAMKWVCLI